MYFKGTKEQCEAYNNEVTNGENYQGSTTRWSVVKEIEGEFFIIKHENYLSVMELVDDIPN